MREPRERPGGWRAVAATLVLLGLHGAWLPAGSAPSTPAVPVAVRMRPARPARAQSEAEEVRALVALVNRHRGAIGCPALIWDERLARLAQRHSEAMARRGYFSHVDPNGDDPFDRMREAGLDFRNAAENIAAGQTTAREVFEDWLHSRGHRKNLENCVYTHHGIGLYQGRWTHEFARY